MSAVQNPDDVARGDRIRAACKAIGISPAELARRCAVSRQYVYHLIDGTREGDQSGVWEKIAGELGVDVRWLKTGSNPPDWWKDPSMVDPENWKAPSAPPASEQSVLTDVYRALLSIREELSGLKDSLIGLDGRIHRLEERKQAEESQDEPRGRRKTTQPS